MGDGTRSRERHDAFGVKKRGRFLDALSEDCNVEHAARLAGAHKSTAYRHHREDPAFAAQWMEALAQGYVRLEEKLLARALKSLDDAPAAEEEGAASDEGIGGGDRLRPPPGGQGVLRGRTVFNDTQLALALLMRHKASVAAGRMAPLRAGRWSATAESAEAALGRQLDLLARRLEKEDAAEARRIRADIADAAAPATGGEA